MLSPEDIKKYIDNDGRNCPYCNSSDFEYVGRLYKASNEYNDDFDIKYCQSIECRKCKKKWEDVYVLKLYTIEESIDE